MHGTQDPLVSHLQSQRLYSANFAQGGSPRLELQLLDEGHGGPMFNARIPRVVDFIGREIGIAPVPVPASLPMLIAGVGAFAALRRSRRA